CYPYHLKPGGVTTVIKRQINATRSVNDYIVLTGEAPAGNDSAEDDSAGRFPAEIAVIPGLAYDDQPDRPEVSAEETVAAIIKAIRTKWNKGCDLIHIHNPLLAKNKQFLKIIRGLQASGMRLFLQVHDFAEDGRPRHYFADEPYPENCHWGVINSRDRDILVAAGARPEGVHLISNSVSPFKASRKRGRERLALYPVRAIRRKNIGEALLLSLFFEKVDQLAITLPPNSPADMPGYKSWQDFAGAHHLPVLFAASSSRDFDELVAEATVMISTSITEGFGFAFLEPWTAGKPLAGRKLPALCHDFEKGGVNLGHLYPSLSVPSDWLPTEELKQKIYRAAEAACRAFGIPFREEISGRFTAVADRPAVDYGMLDEPFQQMVLERVLSKSDDRARLKADNPGLTFPENILEPEFIAASSEAVRRAFADTVAAGQLVSAYQAAMDMPLTHRLDKQVLLDRFFNPDRFNLLQWG
ncbi:MAG: hypothetical protein ACOCPQ_05835, partial [Desulfosudaceae bacterium]